jgi:hypothetical protein
VAGDTTVLPPHSHHLKRNKKPRQLPIEFFFPPLLLSIVSKYSRSHTQKTDISVPIVGVRQPHFGKCYGRNYGSKPRFIK